jgi:dimethylamine/trimethylamine dehydrogenase|tara:strand:- start:4229 stop:6187 length:1959 start_codon:yes stop_codon:yes gene_type:complete
MPHTHAAMREVRAEGGWGVVNTGYCSIHPSSDDAPLPYCRLWDEEDVKVHSLMVDAVHRHGALAGVELWHGGSGIANRLTRVTPISVSGISADSSYPGWISLTKSRSMDRQDIREFRRWHVDAARRAKSAGFDIVYIYAGMGYGPYQFLLPWMNKRTDEYGGSLQNRVRLMREVVEEMKEAIGQTCAIAVRFSTDELLKIPGDTLESEAHDIISTLSDVPDLWDVKSSSWTRETASARFSEQGAQEPWSSFVKPLTSRPVVGVGRFTSPDEMVSQIKRGVLDLIGAARPSIADPFLPRKIDEGREDEIRECIGCNICVSSYHDGVPVRCTQNPTMGEEWRRNWHPERIPAGDTEKSILIVGAGPAGLECTLALAQRGFAVTLAEAREELGGRVTRESRLPGLATWARVRDYRLNLIQTIGNVNIYRSSPLSAQDVIDFGCDHTVIATGAHWTHEMLSTNGYPVSGIDAESVFTPDDILAGAEPEGPVVIYDFDHYYMGSCLAEMLRQRGSEVTIVTPANAVSAWTFMSNELADIRVRMIDLDIAAVLEHFITGFSNGTVQLASIYRDTDISSIACESLVVVGARTGNDQLFKELTDRTTSLGINSLRSIGDCRAPGAIVHAVYSGHECARNIDNADTTPSIAWERPMLSTRI